MAAGEDGNEVGRNEDIGELWVRAPHVTPGYWNKPEATRELLSNGWLHAGDMAFQDEDGYFHVDCGYKRLNAGRLML